MRMNVPTLVAAFALAVGAGAQPVPGAYAYNFYSTNLPVFWIDESYSTDDNGSQGTLTVELTPRGRFAGTFIGHYDDGTVMFDFDMRLSGGLSGAAPQYHVLLKGSGGLRGTAFGRPIRGSESLRQTLDFDATTGIASGTQRVKVCLARYGCQDMSEPFSFDVHDGEVGAGDWSLALEITSPGPVISGTARVTLAAGRTADFGVRGRYSSRTGVANLQLRGTGDARGVVIKLQTDSEMKLKSMRGKLFGQTIDMAAPL